jgi:phosphoadenosine phosphosulfate reductase
MNLAKSSQDFEDLTTAEIVTWALERFNPRIGLACSFQAEESVLIDLMHRVRGTDFRLFGATESRNL